MQEQQVSASLLIKKASQNKKRKKERNKLTRTNINKMLTNRSCFASSSSSSRRCSRPRFCEKNLKSCATPADVESQCVAATKDLSLVAKLEDEKGPLRQAVSDLVMDAMAKDKGCTTKGYIDEKWADALRRSAQDDVGMRDYALQDTGADVVMGGGGKNILGGGKKALTSPTFTPKGARWTTDQACRLGLQQCKDVGGPLEAINRDKEKGRCFAFGGAEGSLTVKLPEPITPFAFTLEHLNKVYSEQGGDSAPRAFKVYGYEDAAALGAAAAALQQQQDAQGNSTVASGGEQGAEQQQQQQQQRELGVEAEESSFEDPGILLLEATYDIHAGNPVQTWYSLRPGAKKHPVRYVRLQVDSNYGNPDYTCVYRFRAHSTQ